MGEKDIAYKFKCSGCGLGDKEHGAFLTKDDIVCPKCASPDISKWPKPRRGRPPLKKTHVSVDLFPATVQLAKDRAKRESIPFCEAIDKSITEANGQAAAKLERSRLTNWRCLRFVAIRKMTKEEQEVFNEVFYMFAAGKSMPAEASEDTSINIIRSRLAEAQRVHGTPHAIADEWVTTFCGLLSDRPGVASLWAYTLWDIYQQSNSQQTVTMDTWVRSFAEGVPTTEATANVWQEQSVFFGGTTSRNYTEMVSEWPR